MFKTKAVEKIKTHFLFSIPPRKYGGAGQASDDNTIHNTEHALCMLDN